MHLHELEFIFNRALSLVFAKKKMLLTYVVLLVCGVLAVFCRALAVSAGDWVGMSLAFLPVFLCSGILLSTGVLLIRVYHDEVKMRFGSYNKILREAWELIISTSYLAVPLILTYLVLWIILGIFYLLEEIPGLGSYLGTILAFGPFLLIVGSLLLCVITLFILFFITPAVALRSGDRLKVTQMVVKRLRSNAFGNLVLLITGSLPLLFVAGILTLAAVLTRTSYLEIANQAQLVMTWFFLMIPFTALLTPAVLFFFNFAAEAHVLMVKKMSEEAR